MAQPIPARCDLQRSLLLRPESLHPAAAKSVDGPGAGNHLAAVRKSLGNKILLSGFDRDASATNGQGIATLHHGHVLIEFMHVWRGNCGLAASPEGHLTSIQAVENEALDPGCRLTARGDFIRRTLHEFREIV